MCRGRSKIPSPENKLWLPSHWNCKGKIHLSPIPYLPARDRKSLIFVHIHGLFQKLKTNENRKNIFLGYPHFFLQLYNVHSFIEGGQI